MYDASSLKICKYHHIYLAVTPNLIVILAVSIASANFPNSGDRVILRFVRVCGAELTLLPTTVSALLADGDFGSGTVILTGQAGYPDRLTARKFVELAGYANARVVLIFAHPVE